MRQFVRFVTVAAIMLSLPPAADACLFCEALASTLSDDINDATFTVIAERAGDKTNPGIGRGMQATQFTPKQNLKGDWPAEELITAFTRPDEPPSDAVLLFAFGDKDDVAWLAPLPLGKVALKYLGGLDSAPESGSDRLAFFLPYLVAEDRHVADDAYNEFARAPYSDIVGLGDRIDRRWVLEHLKAALSDASVPPRRTRLMWTLLSVCGKPEDVIVFNRIASGKDLDCDQLGFDAALGCYMSLGGDEALHRVAADFIQNSDREMVLSAVNAIRFHAVETGTFSKAKLATALHPLLDQASMAAQIIPDLARMEDWTIAERLLELYRREDARDVRSHIINYLRVCPSAQVKQWVAQCREIDPDAVRRSETIFGKLE